MKKEVMIIEKRNGKTWETVNVYTDPVKIYESLAKDMIAKKLHKCTYIKTIKDVCNYDGTRNITVAYDNGVRRVYTIEW